MPTPPIGPSTGWIASKISADLKIHEQVLRATGATAAEFVMASTVRNDLLMGHELTYPLDYLSIHIPVWTCSSYRGESEETLCQIQSIFNIHQAAGTSIHPDTTPVEILRTLADRHIPLGIENMGARKAHGKHIAEVERVLEATRGMGVLDLQHAYEVARQTGQDPVRFTKEFAEAMLAQQGILHLHLSGEVRERGVQLHNHAQLPLATNKEEILLALAEVLALAPHPTPIILEGDPLPDMALLPAGTSLPPSLIPAAVESAIAATRKEIELLQKTFPDLIIASGGCETRK